MKVQNKVIDIINKENGVGISPKRGIALIALVMLIVFVSIVVLGLTTFILQRFRKFDADQKMAQCLYLAQAGVHSAVYNFRLHDIGAPNGYFSTGQTNIDVNNYFIVNRTGSFDADLLMVNTATAALGGTGNRDLLNLTIQNATNSKTITIDRMIVTWNNALQLINIRINGTNKWNGTLSSPANADLNLPAGTPNFTLNTTPTIYPIDRLRFSGNMTGATISIQFVMTDGSIRNLTALPLSNNNNFTVKSSGKVTGSPIYRTIQADYNALTAKLINVSEISTQITP